MSFSGFIAVGCGGLLGCWLRYLLAALFNPLFPTLPMGTLAANLIGGLLMGCTMGVFEHFQALPPAARLLVTTGFLGGLTTFSTFSAEANTLLLRQQYLWFFAHIASHLLGTLSLTMVGIMLTRGFFRY